MLQAARRLGRLDLAIAAYAVLCAFVSRYESDLGREYAITALLAVPVAVLLRRRPYAAAGAIVAGSLVLRLAWIGLNPTDPLENAAYAFDRLMAGANPYDGHVYPNGTTYAYGPLGIVLYRAGVAGEVLAAIGISAVLAWHRAWLTLVAINGLPLFLFNSVNGASDHLPTFLLASALTLVPIRPAVAGAVLAAAIAVKPYAAAWLLPAIGLGGWGLAAVAGVTSVLLWAPVLFVWGIPSFLASIRGLEELRRSSVGLAASWTIADAPGLRLLVVPFSLAGLVWRSWRGMLLLGAAGFFVFLGFAPWANWAHMLPLVVVVGMALESNLPRDADMRFGEIRWFSPGR